MADRPARTLLEQRIRERCLTFEEFVQHAETFARDNHEPGTLSLRHLQRLVSGQQLGALRPATARLLEHIFSEPIAALLAPPKTTSDSNHPIDELRQLLNATRRVDRSAITLLHQQLDGLRQLDRQFGAIVVHDELNASLRAFDQAADFLPSDPTDERPYIALDPVHLAHWRGSALALFGHPDAITVLTDALNHLDPTFVRTETSLQVDLATAHAANGDRDEARTHATHAIQLATQVGSARLHRRSTTLLTTLC